ncbi:LPP20 family lipoprotein [Shewanella atlantica]|uniref:LPP20 lipoprotein n=1 Tax=Shewanella atlantica TaxID=271099 RepID=A0A431WD67_9GAMM|nr:LPP20 family lipoprotein [Shewanella atlantica]RTR33207.1 hypothetical protein EKG39_05520 [Shewanella atlantica]
MAHFFIKACLVVGLTFIVNAVSATPLWLSDLPFEACQQDAYLCGVGQGDTLAEAKSSAKADIAKQLSSHVESQTEINSHLQDGKVTRAANTKVTEYSELTLTSPLILLQSEQIDGVWSVAIAYDRRSSESKLNLWLAKAPCEHGKNVFLAKTVLLASGLEALSCQPKLYLTQAGHLWSLSHSQGSFSLEPSDYESLFSSIDNPLLELSVSANRLTPSQYYHVSVISEEQGYLSLFQVLESGQVSVWLENQKVIANKKLTFPDLSLYEGLASEIPEGKDRTFDMNVALLCSKPFDSSVYEQISVQHLTDQSSRLNPLLKIMERCEFATQRINTRY